MEALLLTLDVISLIGLCIVVIRAAHSNNPDDMGWFAYSVKRVRKAKPTFANQETPHA